MSKISGQFQDICEISGISEISGQLGALLSKFFHSLVVCTDKNNNVE